MLLSREQFEKVLRRYGNAAVSEAIRHYREAKNSSQKNLTTGWSFSSKAARAAHRDLFNTVQDEELFKLYLESDP